MAAVTPPPLLEGAQPHAPPPPPPPTAKERKYDRQLRLWAAAGQQALEAAHVLLLVPNHGGTTGVVGVEALKNLVLPGVGAFTIVDGGLVTERDLGVNFFVEAEAVGRPRAEVCRNLLCELNPDVRGHAVNKTAEDFLADADLSRFQLILLVAPTLLQTVMKKVAEAAWKLCIPLFHIHCAGFYSHFSIQLPASFPIVDTHPDPVSTQDLRLLTPWPELLEHMEEQTVGLESMSDHDHGHVPYLLILLFYLERWKETHDGKYPENYKDKTAFREMVSSKMRTDSAEGVEENFEEAISAVLKSLKPPTVPSGLKAIFEEDECKVLTTNTANFWIIAQAIRDFVATNADVPLPGALPDMKAQSKDYIALQRIYRAKAQQDLVSVVKTVQRIEAELGRGSQSRIDVKEIEAFCKGAAFVKLIKGLPLCIPQAEKGFVLDNARSKTLVRELGHEDSLLRIYIAFSALDMTIEEFGRGEGATILDIAGSEKFTLGLEQNLDILVQSLRGSSASSLDDAAWEAAREALKTTMLEVQRSGGAELHNTASLAGGIAAQEAIKVLTKQYVPVDNTCVVDGITSRSAVFRI